MLEKKRIQQMRRMKLIKTRLIKSNVLQALTVPQLELGSLLNGKMLPFESLRAKVEILWIKGHLDRHTPAEGGIRLRYMQAYLIEHVTGLHVKPIGDLGYFSFRLQVR